MDNDFHQTDSIFRLFDGLEVQDLDQSFSLPNATIPNGHKVASDSSNNNNNINITNGAEIATKATNGNPNGETIPSEPSLAIPKDTLSLSN